MSTVKRLNLLFITCLVLAPLTALAGAEASWSEDYSSSLQTAKAEKKPILVLFTGSDWCPPCKMMDARVFGSDDFAAYARKNLVLVKADFPRRATQSKEQKDKNNKLAERFGIEAFPTVLLLSAEGEVLSKTVGAQYNTPDKFLEMVKDTTRKS